jgi:hypothetical protein
MAFAIAGGKAEQENCSQGEGRSEPARMGWTKLFHDLGSFKPREVKLNDVKPGEVEPDEVNVNELTSACGFAARFTFLL